MRSILTWLSDQDEEGKSSLRDSIMLLVFFLLVFILSLVIDPDSPDYYRAHNGLLVVCVFSALLLFVRRSDVLRITSSIIEHARHRSLPQIKDVSDYIQLLVFCLTIVSVLFVLDLSFLENFGLRIGAVVGLALLSILRSAISTLRN